MAGKPVYETAKWRILREKHGLSNRAIGKRFGCSEHVVGAYLRKYEAALLQEAAQGKVISVPAEKADT